MDEKLLTKAISIIKLAILITVASCQLSYSKPAIDYSNRDSLKGAPEPPWIDWSHYHNYAEIVNILFYLNQTFPEIVDIFSIGKSWLNKKIYCIKLTNESRTHLKPKVLFVGYHHTREPISAELPLYFAVKAATSFSVSQTITHMLNDCEIYIVPALNVDGFEALSRNEWQRKNLHPFDEDGDGLVDEDPPDDEDRDGYIEDLFYFNGTHYYFIRWEGVDDDGDGLLNEDWPGGVDLNRNYAYQWNATCESGSQDPFDEDYRGPAPFSEPETQAVRTLALNHNFKYAVSLHSGAEFIGFPWGYTRDPAPDHSKFEEIAAALSALVGAPYGQNSGLYTSSGIWDDWMYGNRGTYAFTCEIYENNDAWQYEPGPKPYTWWEKGVFQFFNPEPKQIEAVIQRWLPIFTYITERAIAETYDIAITNLTPSKTIVGRGYPININVTAENLCDLTQNLNITIYANETQISSQPTTLTAKKSTVITFTCLTSNLTYGCYTLWVKADILPGETITKNNIYIDDLIKITIPGDVNGDYVIDIYDAVTIAVAFSSTPSAPNWNSNADITDDQLVDIFDLVVMAVNFGETTL